MIRMYLKTGNVRSDQENQKKAIESVLAGRLNFGKASEEFDLRKTTIPDAVKRVKKCLCENQSVGVETVYAQELSVSDVIGTSLWTIFTQKQEKELSIYLQKCSY